jgi:hypothetical protein
MFPTVDFELQEQKDITAMQEPMNVLINIDIVFKKAH